MTIHDLTDIEKGEPARGAADWLRDSAERAGVAVIIPTYNYAEFLGQALDSVMAQTVAPAEIIVVDDGSTDNPEDVTRNYPRVQLIRIPNQGLAEARNVGLRAAKSRYVWFLDADDLLEPHAIEKGLDCMAANPGASFVYGAYIRIDKDDRPQSEPILYPLGSQAHTRLFRRNYIGVPATVLYDREKVLACSGFDQELCCCEDYDLYLRMTRLYSVAHYPDLVARYRLHGRNMSNDVAKMLEWHLYVLMKHRPPTDASAQEKEMWKAGIQHAKGDHAVRAWSERSPPRSVRWRNRRNMFSLAPFSTARAALQSSVWRILPGAVRKRVKVLLTRPNEEPAPGAFCRSD